MATILKIEKRKPTEHEIELCIKWLKKNNIKVHYSEYVGYVVVPYDPDDIYSSNTHQARWNEYTDKLFARLHKKELQHECFYVMYDDAVQKYAEENKEAIINDIS